MWGQQQQDGRGSLCGRTTIQAPPGGTHANGRCPPLLPGDCETEDVVANRGAGKDDRDTTVRWSAAGD